MRPGILTAQRRRPIPTQNGRGTCPWSSALEERRSSTERRQWAQTSRRSCRCTMSAVRSLRTFVGRHQMAGVVGTTAAGVNSRPVLPRCRRPWARHVPGLSADRVRRRRRGERPPASCLNRPCTGDSRHPARKASRLMHPGAISGLVSHRRDQPRTLRHYTASRRRPSHRARSSSSAITPQVIDWGVDHIGFFTSSFSEVNSTLVQVLSHLTHSFG